MSVAIFQAFTFLKTLEKNTTVSLHQVIAKTPKAISDAKKRTYPPNIAKFLGGDKNLEVLHSWLEEVPEEQHTDFINNLESIIDQAYYGGKTDSEVYEIINAYKNVKMAQLSEGVWEQPMREIQRGATFIFVSMCVGMIVLCTLTLVLLAIERNTRLKAEPNKFSKKQPELSDVVV